MQTKLSSGDKIIFTMPYFESYLYHYGEILFVKDKFVGVRYFVEVETPRGFEKIILTTEILLSYIWNN